MNSLLTYQNDTFVNRTNLIIDCDKQPPYNEEFPPTLHGLQPSQLHIDALEKDAISIVSLPFNLHPINRSFRSS